MASKIDFKKPEHAAKAVVTLYRHQTIDEQQAFSTVYQNEVGFNAVDAAFGSSIAQQLLTGKKMTQKQFAVLQKLLPKYRNQLEQCGWEDTPLPEGVDTLWEPTPKPERKGDGLLTIDDQGRLEFIPYVYPTQQLKVHGWWRGSRKNWTWVTHFNLGNVNLLLRLWPDTQVDDTVQTALDQLLEKDELPPEIEKHPILFPFQKESIQFLNGSPKAMLALAPGLGKTACSIFAADIAPSSEHILIVAPLTLVWNWQNEIRKWLGEDSVQFHSTPDKWPEPARWVVTNYETVARNLEAIEEMDWDILIVDESILVKNRKAKRTQAIKQLAKGINRVWELSGSPASRFYDDLWAQFNILDQKRFRSYWRFARQYCHVVDNGWGLQIVANRIGSPERLQQDLADIYFCRTQDQVLDLPDWLFESYEIPLYHDQWKPYMQMATEFWAALPEGDVVLSPNVLSQLTRLIQIASSPSIIGGKARAAKWDAAIDMLEWVGKPAIIWTNFIATAKGVANLATERGYTVEVLTGQTPQKDREAIVHRFQTLKTDVLVAHPKVGKFGLTLTAAQTAIYLERNYEGDNYYQSLHRVRRIGTTQRPLIIHLLATDPDGLGVRTVDHVIDKVLEYRKDGSLALTTDLIRKGATEDGIPTI